MQCLRLFAVLLLFAGMLVPGLAQEELFHVSRDGLLFEHNEALAVDEDSVGFIAGSGDTTLTYTITNIRDAVLHLDPPEVQSDDAGLSVTVDEDAFADLHLEPGASHDFTITINTDGSLEHAQAVGVMVQVYGYVVDDDGESVAYEAAYSYRIAADIDIQAPQWRENFPVLTAITATSATLTVASDETATVSLVILEADAEVPSREQVRAGHDASGDDADMATTFDLPDGDEREVSIAGLEAGTTYQVLIIAEDIFGNLQTAITALNLETTAVPILRVTSGGGTIADESTHAINGAVAGVPGTIAYQLHNDGAQDLSITSITTSEAINVVVGTSPEITQVAADDLQDLEISITAQEPGDWSVQLIITSDDFASPEYRWTMTGVAIAEDDPPAPEALNWLPDYPLLSERSPVSLEFLLRADGVGVAYFVVLNNGAPAPSAQQVRDGVAGDGETTDVVASGDVQLVADDDATVRIGNLDFDTTYDVYFVALSSMGILQADPALLVRSTDAMDEDAPQWSTGYPQVASVGTDTVEIALAADKPGRAYAVALSPSSVPPSAQQVREGVDGEGGSAAAHAALDYTDTVGLRLRGLSDHRQYAIFVVAENTSQVLQSQVQHDDLKAITLFALNAPSIRRSEGFTTVHNGVAPGSAEAWQELRNAMHGQSPQDMRAWYWDSERQRYQEFHADSEDVPLYTALFFAARRALDLDFSGRPHVGSSEMILHQGWNFIGIGAHAESNDGGTVVTQHQLADLQFRGDSDRLLDGEELEASTLTLAWRWDAHSRQYQATNLAAGESLQAGNAYWLYHDRNDDTIILERQAVGDAASATSVPVFNASAYDIVPPPPPGVQANPPVPSAQDAEEAMRIPLHSDH
ncbi:MAG: hypothetical protein EA401_14380 [Planctomycetota bacterium]|nr:MAG: hypothetical protein EA401_14380 [Planctomycetota bacterium]